MSPYRAPGYSGQSLISNVIPAKSWYDTTHYLLVSNSSPLVLGSPLVPGTCKGTTGMGFWYNTYLNCRSTNQLVEPGDGKDQRVMERLVFDQARFLCTHSPNLNRWGIVSRQNKTDMELDFPVPAPQSQEQLIQYLLAKRTRRSPSTTHRAAPW